MTDLVLIDIKTCALTFMQMVDKVKALQRNLPMFEIFMDGDVNAIVGRLRA